MSILQKLNALKNNVFGGPGNTGETTPIARKSAIELANTNPLVGKLDDDPFAFSSMVYPNDMSDYKQSGHYMIFYINVRNAPDLDEKKSPRGFNMSDVAGTEIKRVKNFDRGFNMSDIAGDLPAVTTGDSRGFNIGDMAGPIYKDAKEAASRPNIGQIAGGLSATAAAANQDSFRGRLTGPAAALVDSAAATRPTIADVAGGISDAAAAANQESFRGRVTGAVAAASTTPARPNIGDISGAAASAAPNPTRNFNMSDVTGGYAAPTAPARPNQAQITNTPNYGTARGFNIGQITNATVTPTAPNRPNIGQITGGYATAPARPNQADIAGPLQEKLVAVRNFNMRDVAGGIKNYKKNTKKNMNTKINEHDTLKLARQESQTGLNAFAKLTTRIDTSIALYLPPMIESTYGVKYNATETGTLGFLAAKGSGALDALKRRDEEELARITSGVGGDMLKALLLRLGDEATSLLGLGEGGGALAQKLFFGEATNPYMEVLFENVEMRSFTYSFNFTPKSSKETQEIKEIIETFRFHMAPRLQNDHGRYMTLPAEFDIHYMYQDGEGNARENTYLNKIATCVLTNCTVNYTPNGAVQTHADGSPVSINMQLSFQETEMITKDKIKQGF